MKLYVDPASTVCRGILLFAAEQDITLEHEYINLWDQDHLKPEFLKINPNHAVPVLDDGDLRLTESSAILKYLADTAGSCAYPADLRERARVNAAMDWFNTGFYRQFGYLTVYPQVLPYLAMATPSSQAELLRVGAAGSVDALGILDRHMIGENDFVCGPRVTIADYFGLPMVALGELVDYDLTPWPNVRRWLAGMQARPAWAAIDVAFQGWRSAVKAARAA